MNETMKSTEKICEHPNRVDHCWHVAGTSIMDTEESNTLHLVCCFCGLKKVEPHGRFLPIRG